MRPSVSPCVSPSARLLRSWLLALALFLGQAAMLAHSAEHLDAGEAPHACRVCLAGQSVDGPALPPCLPVLHLSILSFVSPSAAFVEGESAALLHCPARGPPAA